MRVGRFCASEEKMEMVLCVVQTVASGLGDRHIVSEWCRLALIDKTFYVSFNFLSMCPVPNCLHQNTFTFRVSSAIMTGKHENI